MGIKIIIGSVVSILLIFIILTLESNLFVYLIDSKIEQFISGCDGVENYVTGDFYYDAEVILNKSENCFNNLPGLHPFLHYDIEVLDDCSEVYLSCGHVSNFLLCLSEFYDIECKNHIIRSTWNESHSGVICKDGNNWKKIY